MSTDPEASPDERASSQPAFWDVRYEENEHLFGVRPNHFVAAWADHLPRGVETVELGAGEGRNLIHLAQQKQHRVTAVDFAPTALQEAKALAAACKVPMETIEADVRTWTPGQQWDVVVVTFVQLLPAERPGFYALVKRLLRPGGYLIGEWFRPAHLNDGYARIGPSRPDRMIPVEELRRQFARHQILHCSAVTTHLADGPLLRGRAGTVQCAVRMKSL